MQHPVWEVYFSLAAVPFLLLITLQRPDIGEKQNCRIRSSPPRPGRSRRPPEAAGRRRPSPKKSHRGHSLTCANTRRARSCSLQIDLKSPYRAPDTSQRDNEWPGVSRVLPDVREPSRALPSRLQVLRQGTECSPRSRSSPTRGLCASGSLTYSRQTLRPDLQARSPRARMDTDRPSWSSEAVGSAYPTPHLRARRTEPQRRLRGLRRRRLHPSVPHQHREHLPPLSDVGKHVLLR